LGEKIVLKMEKKKKKKSWIGAGYLRMSKRGISIVIFRGTEREYYFVPFDEWQDHVRGRIRYAKVLKKIQK